MKLRVYLAKWKTLTCCLFLVFLVETGQGQEPRIQGFILDKHTSLPVGAANIIVLGTNLGDSADSTGFYEIGPLVAGTYFVRVTRIGYEPKVEKNVTVKEKETTQLDIKLTSKMLQLSEVEVEAERLWEKYLSEASLVNVKRIKSEDMLTIPGTIDDPARAVQIFSGVAGGGDYSGFLAVRGGSPDQNQVIRDGVVIPNPYRLRLAFGGGLSSLNPNTIEDIYLHLGGFSAEYGNSLSSILEVESRLALQDRIHAQASLNFTDMNGLIEGPLPSNIGSYMVSARRTYYDFIANELSKTNSAYPFHFEIEGKLSLNLSKSSRLSLSFYRNREGTELQQELSDNLNISEDALSYVASASWKVLFGSRWQVTNTLSYYQDKLAYRASTSDTLALVQEYESLNQYVKNFGYKGDVRYQTGESSWLGWGAEAKVLPTQIDFEAAGDDFLYARVESPANIDFDQSYSYYGTYLESSTRATDRLHLRIGARFDYSTLIDQGALSPRLSGWYHINSETVIEGSWGIFHQYPDPSAIYTRNVPIDLSQNLDIITAEKAAHLLLGIDRTIGASWSAKVQLYYIDLDRILLPIDEVNFAPQNSGTGYSRGFELILEKEPSRDGFFNGVFSYAYGYARYRPLDNNNWLPFKYDRRHALTGLLNLNFAGHWTFSVLAQYLSGYPYTNVLGLANTLRPDGTADISFLREDRFQSRFPPFHRINARLSYRTRLGQTAFSFYLDVINLTNRQNVSELTWERQYLEDERQQVTRRVIYMLPIIPSFGISFRI